MDERVTVTVGDDHVRNVHEVAEQLEAAGMLVDEVLGVIGIITGSVPSDRRPGLERLPGVASVEVERVFRVAPPDAAVQ